MGTSLLKSAALLGALFAAVPPAFSAGIGAGTASSGTPGMGAASTMPGTLGPSIRPGTPASPSLGTPTLGTPSTFGATGMAGSPAASITANPMTANQGVGLTASQQSLLMNFGSPSGTGLTPAEQMQMNAQANSSEAARNGTATLLNPSGLGTSATGAVNGSGTGSVSTTSPGVGATTTAAPVVNAPVVNNPGTLAETVPPQTP